MDGFVKLHQLAATLIIASLVFLTPTQSLAEEATEGNVIELPAKDRAFLEQILGKGVVGKAVAGSSISDPITFFPLKDGTPECAAFNLLRQPDARHQGQSAGRT